MQDWFDLVDIPANATLAEPDSDLDDMMGPLAFYYLLIMHVFMILAMYLIDFFRKRRPKLPIPPDEAEVILEAQLLANYDRLERQFRILSALLRCADAA